MNQGKTVKETLHEFIDTKWDEFIAERSLIDISGSPVDRPTADTEDNYMTLEEASGAPTSDATCRVVRSPMSGDKVYYLDDITKTKKWIKSPEELEELGFGFNDVQDVTDEELAQYRMTL